jgi:hypothetical protein
VQSRARPGAANALAAVADDHPIVVSYLGDTDGDHKPRRLADLISRRELRRTRTYAELLKPLGIEQQLTVLTSRSLPAAGRCWTFARQKRPWSDRELALAIRLQPVLVTLDAYAEPYARPVTRWPPAADAPATVRKHVEHAYDKLGVHDRLLAVERARQEGLL